MKVSNFIVSNSIPKHLAAGFLAHLRMTDEHEVQESKLVEEYKSFSGLDLGKNNAESARPVAETSVKQSVPAEAAAATDTSGQTTDAAASTKKR